MSNPAPDAPALDPLSRQLGTFLRSLLPVFLIIGALLSGVAALVMTPREEEPQIVVPLADVMVSAPGLSARQIERQVTTPLENLLYQIDGVEYVYSASSPGMAIVTVRFYVGEPREESLVKIYNKMHSNIDMVPEAVESWIVKPLEIDDVPILLTTLWSEDPEKTGDAELRRLAEEVALRLQSVHGTNRVEVTGGRPREFRVELNPEALASRMTAPLDVAWALQVSNSQVPAGEFVSDSDIIRLEAGPWIRTSRELENMVVNVVDGQPVYLKDVATVVDGPAEPDTYSWLGFGPAAESAPKEDVYPAVTVSTAKRRGTNAVTVSRDVLRALDDIKETLFPPHVHYEIVRDSGETANQKVSDLVTSLGLAVIIVIIFIGICMGWRAALVVGLAVPLAYGVTLGVNYLAGYTINRVTLFALILALGLLVDDPITGIDNIDRYLKMRRFRRLRSILLAMQEIRTPLIMSTIAIILSFVPLFYITGMMGPYMAPMAVNVPLAVIMSTGIAFLITPWLANFFLRGDTGGEEEPAPAKPRKDSFPVWSYGLLMRPLLEVRKRGAIFLGVVGLLLVLSVVVLAFRVIPLKLLPFDNKDEFQLVIDMPEGTSAERTDAALRAFGEYLRTVPEVRAFASFAGTNSPMDFNGMVRRYYLREDPHMGDMRVTLAGRPHRRHQSSEIILRIRDGLHEIAREHGANLKVVQTPPGPPVLSTITVEIHGTEATPYDELREGARLLAARMEREPFVVDVDTSVEAPQKKMLFALDREKAALSGVSTADAARTAALAVDGMTVGYAEQPDEAAPLPIRLQLPRQERRYPSDLDTLTVKGMQGVVKIRESGGVTDAPQPLVPLGEIGSFQEMEPPKAIYRKNLQRVAYVYGEIAGRAPGEAIHDIFWDEGAEPLGEGAEPRPVDSRNYILAGGGDGWSLPDGVRAVWSAEGEWYITIKVFRDLGIAFGVACIGIFVVLTIQTGSTLIALIIMLAIPLTMIGIVPGFWFLNVIGETRIAGYPNPSYFTATAMIGMIALAGIVVRNSLILVEFIHQSLREGMPFQDAIVQAGAVRMRPVLLTAGTTMLGNIVITLDPIFNGLAWAIIFGIGASTVFTLGVVPIVYYLVFARVPGHGLPPERTEEP